MAPKLVIILIALLSITQCNCLRAQGKLYTARGYWEETNNPVYKAIQKKIVTGDTLTQSEEKYRVTYKAFLDAYYEQMPEVEKEDYNRLRIFWDTNQSVVKTREEEVKGFEWRGRDRLSAALYGVWYGASIAVVGDFQSSASAAVPLITGGLWMLGPVINPTKYSSITRNTLRASNTGKLLGIIYGASLGAALAGTSDNSGRWEMGLSAVGSIALGEIAFYAQQKKNYSEGHIEIMRHYGFLGPWVGWAAIAPKTANGSGVALLAGGIAGLFVGNKVAKKYDYTAGDVDAISSLTLASTGLGLAAVSEQLNNQNADRALFMIPAATSLAASLWAQRAVRGVHLTNRQGNNLNLATAGSALVGIGIVSLIKPNSAVVAIGVPAGLAFLTHQILFHKYKTENLSLNFRGSRYQRNRYHLALQVTPESIYLNKQIPMKDYAPQVVSRLHSSFFKLTVTF